MSVHAGSILTVGGNNVIDRIQSAGLGDVRLPIETIREVGNRLVVDKIPGEPDFTFTMESLDVSIDLMAWLTGKVGTSATASAGAPGYADAAGTEYKWEDCSYVNVASPWKDPTTGSAGTVTAGHLIPAYYPTRIRYRFGVTDFATQEVELGGATFYYGDFAPVEEIVTSAGSSTFTTADVTVHHRIGGSTGTTFADVFGVIVAGQPKTLTTDYTVTGGNGSAATITFLVAPTAGQVIRVCYFTSAAKAYPQTVHASNVVKPGAVRGRNIAVYLGTGGSRAKLGGVQTVELEATTDGEIEREMGTIDPTGRVINGRDCTGTLTVRSPDTDAFIALLAKVTGVSASEVFGFLNLNSQALEIVIYNPKSPATAIKTLYVSDAIFSVPGTPARVNAATDFSIQFESKDGTFSEFKGAKA